MCLLIRVIVADILVTGFNFQAFNLVSILPVSWARLTYQTKPNLVHWSQLNLKALLNTFTRF